ncbi:hypothetical protein [Virgibacillus salexigens]|uniref:Uncharacterized protein n=1 Tax=Virgibacillus massiliensis TaxID=1462526 RepID=A0A024QGT9_9BACI|nr:hypothetical protein [Virgibacillus massiliensis]CDQ41773.1 hypothetical protein BN990_04150 [Virgibacillus massiliensis]
MVQDQVNRVIISKNIDEKPAKIYEELAETFDALASFARKQSESNKDDLQKFGINNRKLGSNFIVDFK